MSAHGCGSCHWWAVKKRQTRKPPHLRYGVCELPKGGGWRRTRRGPYRGETTMAQHGPSCPAFTTRAVPVSDLCPRCGVKFNTREDKLLTCPICKDKCCTKACVAGAGVPCFRCEEEAQC